LNITEYTEVNEILNWLKSKLCNMLNKKLVGIYLYGSLVWGDFDRYTSDIDLMIAIETNINRNDFLSLNKIHSELGDKFKDWKDRIEIAYISINTLKTFKLNKNEIAVISPGEPFNMKKAGIDWLINLYLIRMKSLVLFGPNPSSIIEKSTKIEFLEAVKNQLLEWHEWITHSKNSYSSQCYATLTICRALYTLNTGEQPSKRRARTTWWLRPTRLAESPGRQRERRRRWWQRPPRPIRRTAHRRRLQRVVRSLAECGRNGGFARRAQ